MADPVAGFRRVFQGMLDGLGWRSLTAEWDWANACRRIERNVFAAEAQST